MMLLLILVLIYYTFLFFILKKKLFPPTTFPSTFKRILFLILVIAPFGDTIIGYITYQAIAYNAKELKIYKTINSKDEQEAYWFSNNMVLATLDKNTLFYNDSEKELSGITAKPLSQKVIVKDPLKNDFVSGYLNYCVDTVEPNDTMSCHYADALIQRYALKHVIKVPFSPYVYSDKTLDLPFLDLTYFNQELYNSVTHEILGKNQEITFSGSWIFKYLTATPQSEKTGNRLAKETFVEKMIPNPLLPTDRTFIRHQGGFLVFDMNQDGFISTRSIQESKVFFDLKKDGMKKKVGWIKSVDALLVFDKNNDGKIDVTNETLGNSFKDGFEEARELIDSNLDGKLDENDVLFDHLKLWFDYNQNGIATVDELKSMHDTGIISINLNTLSSNITVNEHNITKVSEYSNSNAQKGLIFEIHLAYDPRITSLNFQALENFKIDIHTISLPMLRGYGLIKDSFIVYNINPTLQVLATSYAHDLNLIQNSFDQFIDEWTGYNAYKAKIAQKYHLKASIEMADMDRKIWIMERFSGMENLTAPIEAYYESKAKTITVANAITLLSADARSFSSNQDYINKHYYIMKNRNEGMFALQSIFKKVLIGIHYKASTDTFEISDNTALNEHLIRYFNNTSIDMNEKKYLIKIINNLKTDKIFPIQLNDILPRIENKTLLNSINQH